MKPGPADSGTQTCAAVSEGEPSRWDSLGEFLALAVSLEHFAKLPGDAKAKVLADAFNIAVGNVLLNGKSPSRTVKELDNRGSHFYLALYWAQALAEQTEDRELQECFVPVAKELKENEARIVDELNSVQGHPAGYWRLLFSGSRAGLGGNPPPARRLTQP